MQPGGQHYVVSREDPFSAYQRSHRRAPSYALSHGNQYASSLGSRQEQAVFDRNDQPSTATSLSQHGGDPFGGESSTPAHHKLHTQSTGIRIGTGNVLAEIGHGTDQIDAQNEYHLCGFCCELNARVVSRTIGGSPDQALLVFGLAPGGANEIDYQGQVYTLVLCYCPQCDARFQTYEVRMRAHLYDHVSDLDSGLLTANLHTEFGASRPFHLHQQSAHRANMSISLNAQTQRPWAQYRSPNRSLPRSQPTTQHAHLDQLHAGRLGASYSAVDASNGGVPFAGLSDPDPAWAFESPQQQQHQDQGYSSSSAGLQNLEELDAYMEDSGQAQRERTDGVNTNHPPGRGKRNMNHDHYRITRKAKACEDHKRRHVKCTCHIYQPLGGNGIPMQPSDSLRDQGYDDEEEIFEMETASRSQNRAETVRGVSGP